MSEFHSSHLFSTGKRVAGHTYDTYLANTDQLVKHWSISLMGARPFSQLQPTILKRRTIQKKSSLNFTARSESLCRANLIPPHPTPAHLPRQSPLFQYNHPHFCITTTTITHDTNLYTEQIQPQDFIETIKMLTKVQNQAAIKW